MLLEPATHIDERLAAALAPFCDRLDIAGSIRRRRVEVNDIDLVLLPKPGQLEALQRAALDGARCLSSGPENMSIELTTSPMAGQPLQADLFFAQPQKQSLFETVPTNYGSLLLCRTGSKVHNIYLCQRARAADLHWNPQRGLFARDPRTDQHTLLASATEEEIFTILDLDFIPPEKRERP
jgi:DNA polymerase/3'-5' exonuclease PolX